MKVVRAAIAAALVLLHSSCSCPHSPRISVEGSPSQPGIIVERVREYRLNPDCENSKPANASTSTTPALDVVLPVIPRCQEGLYSCWSTVTEMVLEFFGEGRIRQCQQSTQAFSAGDCCGPNSVLIVDSACDLPWFPEFEKWGYEYERSEFPLDPGEVKAQIDAGRPFVFLWTRNEPGTTAPTSPTTPGAVAQPDSAAQPISHMLLAIGYGVDKKTGEPALVVIDPHPFLPSDAAIMPQHEYDGSDGTHLHWEDYVSIRPMK